MNLTTEQLLVLRDHIATVPEWAALPNTADNAFLIADALNLPGTPDFVVWRTAVDAQEIMSNGFVWTAVDTLSNGKARIWDWMTRYGTINPSKANVRQGLRDCFGAGSQMETGIAPHLKRLASGAERLYATGTGTTATPGTMTAEGALSYQQVQQARSM